MPRDRRIPEPYADRLHRVRTAMGAQKLDGYLVQNRMDQIWLTGFTGEDGAALVTPRQLVLLTDGRFDETADQEAPFARKVVRKKRGPEALARECKRFRLEQLGYDPDHTTVRSFTAMRKAVAPTKLISTSRLVGDLRDVKDEIEISRIREAIKIAEQSFLATQRWMKPGQTEAEVAAKLVYEMGKRGAQGPSFPPIVASGPNASLPHYEPGSRELRDGEPVLIDWGARFGWYVSDLTRMVWVGSIPPQIGRLNRIVHAAQRRAIAAIRPGVVAGRVDSAARRPIVDAGYGKQFTHGLGHGIGLDVHESPRLGRRVDTVLKPGMVVTVEPGIYLPGKGGVRLEDDVLVTADGCEVLSTLPHASAE